MSGRCPFSSRRGFLTAAGGIAASVAAGVTARAAPGGPGPDTTAGSRAGSVIEPFRGAHQGGILTTPQNHTYFVALDLTTAKTGDVVALLRAWTEAAARMAEGRPAAAMGDDLAVPAADSGDALGLAPARLTVTFGFGPGLFIQNGTDRYGLASRRPAALVDMPAFNGDQLVEARTGGDLSIQACADDPMVAFHAARQLVRMAYGVAQVRWAQTGFNANGAPEETPRNLMGFKDGTQNPVARPTAAVPGTNVPSGADIVWVGQEGPDWMRGGTYLVVRRIRMALEHWDRTEVDFQEQVVGRHKYSGAPLGSKDEFDALDLDATDKDGNLVIPDTAHVRLAAAASNDGAQILRRGYSYNDGVNFTAERWPPWHQGMEYDAGLFFLCYQRDLRTGFVQIYENMAKLDAMNQFVTHVGGAFFAIPGGVAEGGFIGQGLFDSA